MSPVSDEDLKAAVALRAAHTSEAAAARASGLSPNAFRNRLKRAALRGLMGPAEPLPGFEIASISGRAPDGSFVRQEREAGDAFTVPDGHRVKGVSALVDADGRELVKWVKTDLDPAGRDFVETIRAAFEAYRGTAPLIPPPTATDADLLTVYPIADQHNGLLAWGRETGEAYNLDIGAERLRTCMARLVSQAPPARHALILNLGDWTHADDSKNMTPRGGNILDVDGRHFKVAEAGVRLMMDCIELALARHEFVTVRNLPGNHDPHAARWLTIALACFYASNPRVKIIDDPSEWLFYRFGVTLLGAHHGHKCKPEQMAMTMACERREDWGATLYHWFLYGHIHHETAKEVGDVRCESFQTLASRDAYHAGAGYTSGRSLQAITLHVWEGEVGRHRINVPPPRARRLAA